MRGMVVGEGGRSSGVLLYQSMNGRSYRLLSVCLFDNFSNLQSFECVCLLVACFKLNISETKESPANGITDAQQCQFHILSVRPFVISPLVMHVFSHRYDIVSCLYIQCMSCW